LRYCSTDGGTPDGVRFQRALASAQLMTVACGGSVAAEPVVEAGFPETGPIDATSEPRIVDAGVDVADDTTLSACGCPSGDFCVLWFGPDAGPMGPAGSTRLPDAGVLWSTCATGSLATVCDGGPPQYSGYDVYTNRISWVACDEP
jgi:hypothetical protein